LLHPSTQLSVGPTTYLQPTVSQSRQTQPSITPCNSLYIGRPSPNPATTITRAEILKTEQLILRSTYWFGQYYSQSYSWVSTSRSINPSCCNSQQLLGQSTSGNTREKYANSSFLGTGLLCLQFRLPDPRHRTPGQRRLRTPRANPPPPRSLTRRSHPQYRSTFTCKAHLYIKGIYIQNAFTCGAYAYTLSVCMCLEDILFSDYKGQLRDILLAHLLCACWGLKKIAEK
jgi:hypothetical protein